MKKILNLRFVIVSLVMVCVIFLFCGTLLIGFQMNKANIVENTLEINHVYAKKLSDSAQFMFQTIQQNMELRSSEIVQEISNNNEMRKSLDSMLKDSKYYNSLFVSDANGSIVVSSPNLGVEGRRLGSIGSKQALVEKQFLISTPYRSVTGRFIVLVSQPLWGIDGRYIGFLGGTIYLEENNVLQNILGTHFYKDGSYVYVVDNAGRIIYHPDKTRIGEKVSTNAVINNVIKGKEGSLSVKNTKGIEMLAGYSYVSASKWGVVSQTPMDSALVPNQKMLLQMTIYVLPFLFGAIMISVYLSGKIATPLQELANFSEKILGKEKNAILPKHIPLWYYEVEQIHRASKRMYDVLHSQVAHYKNEALTDSLTNLQNRRAADAMLQEWNSKNRSFALALLDIDYFKNVNDTFGHQIGDEVLMFLSDILRSNLREGDQCFRYGGEEFLILLSYTNQKEAEIVMDRIRTVLNHTISPTGEAISISCGVAYSIEGGSNGSLIHLADKRLYQAKEEGRNRIIKE